MRRVLATSGAVAALVAGLALAAFVGQGGRAQAGVTAPTGPTPSNATTTPVPVAPAPVYEPAASLSAGAAVDSVAVDDVNGDGKPDLVVGNGDLFTASSVSFLLGDGAGDFAASNAVPLAVEPDALVVADVNGDGHLDITATGGCGSSALVSAGDGTFSAPRNSTLGFACLTSSFGGLGDVNGDGKPDLVIAETESAGGCITGPSCDGGNAVAPQLGNGDGTFRDGNGVRNVLTPGSAALVGDVNGDAHADLAVTGATAPTDEIEVDLGNGDGTFGSGDVLTTSPGPRQIAAADLNGDGHLDLAVATDAGVSVLLGNGDATFAPHVDYPTAAPPNSIAIADVNEDGRSDIVTAGATDSGSVSVLAGNGDGTFGGAASYPVGPDPASIAIGDLDGDGAPDIAVADQASSTLSLLLTAAGGSAATTTTTTTTTTTSDLTTTSDFTTTSTGSPSAGVTAQVLPALTVGLDKTGLDFGSLLPGATTTRSLTPTVTSNDTAGYQLAVSRTAFTPGDLPLSIACTTCGLAATPVPAGNTLLEVASAAGPSANAGDDWPATLSLGPIPGAARSGSYSSTITFTVVGL